MSDELFIVQKFERGKWTKTWWTNALLNPDGPEIYNFSPSLKVGLSDARRALAYANKRYPTTSYRIYPEPVTGKREEPL